MKIKVKIGFSNGFGFFIFFIALFLASFLCSVIEYLINGTKVLSTDLIIYLFYNGVWYFAVWGFFIFLAYAVYGFSSFQKITRVLERKSKIKRVTLFFIFSLFCFLVLRFMSVFLAGQEKVKLETKYRYANFFYEKGMENYQDGLRYFDNPNYLRNSAGEIDISSIDEIDFLEMKALHYGAINSFNLYLLYDPTETLNRGDVGPLAFILQELSAWQLRLNVFEDSARGTQSLTLMEKYALVDQGRILLERGKKERDLDFTVKAYELYSSALKIAPLDFEFLEGVREAKQEIERLSFYRSDIEPLFEYPIGTLVALKTQEYKLDSGVPIAEFFLADAMIFFKGDYYFKGVEIRGEDRTTGEIVYLLTSDYAWLKDGELIFATLDKDLSRESFRRANVKGVGFSEREVTRSPFASQPLILPYFYQETEGSTFIGIYSTILLLNHFALDTSQQLFLKGHFLSIIANFFFLLGFPFFIVLVSILSRGYIRRKESVWRVVLAFPFAVVGIYWASTIFIYSSNLLTRCLVGLFSFWVAFGFVVGFYGIFLATVIFIYLYKSRKNLL